MKTLIGIVAAFAAVGASSNPARSQSFKFICVGAGSAQGNQGVRAIGETKYEIEGEGQQISIRDGVREFCARGATCGVAITSELVQVRVRDLPRHDPGYAATFELDRKSLIFKASAGGLGGGWSITGRCKPKLS